ncbi:hypothetical protein SLE2022_168170 [Rubroshorea leprosula]
MAYVTQLLGPPTVATAAAAAISSEEDLNTTTTTTAFDSLIHQTINLDLNLNAVGQLLVEFSLKTVKKNMRGMERARYAYRVQDRLRKQVLVPLHKALQLLEVYMSANEWNALPYNRVTSVAMKNCKGLFVKHDKERFVLEYHKKVKSGEAKIVAGALFPHEIIASLNDRDSEEVVELQWARMVVGVKRSEECWNGKVITLSENPELHLVEGDSLKAKTEFIREMEWGDNIDFQKVFYHILVVATEGKLNEEQSVKRIFVFSNMEFDAANVHD